MWCRVSQSNINWIQALEFANQMSMIEGLSQCYRKNETEGSVNKVEMSCGMHGVSFANGCRVDNSPSKDTAMPYADSETAIEVAWVREKFQRWNVTQCVD